MLALGCGISHTLLAPCVVMVGAGTLMRGFSEYFVAVTMSYLIASHGTAFIVRYVYADVIWR